ncbi:mannose-6-phosphate isomerase, class I [Leadbettera azotonutricia]|uniref:mannose-6-phosphate isomerase n=1 Tax=Leadbettera azotonutricia (strain ATCC BAA-888 / DSM 13862 / ZAS-9) TaxID=545695 RepID=F5Y8W1_LEAAZ|nr:mannose-6-phosphate isomerase, class I [Leadbettera azotonutricia]AEF80800.1 mannose-6-phosphate isomerase, class I [Leadbettera azotonutricia ZAS-9]
MPKNDLRIEILGTSISISADEEQDYLDRLLDTYTKAIEATGKSTGLKDPLKIAILTGFLLCDEAEKARHISSFEIESHEIETLALNLISRLDHALGEEGQTAVNKPIEVPSTDEAPAAAPPVNARPGILKLKNAVKYYEWGSPKWIPELLGQRNISRAPWAELWMGVHPEGPSCIADGDQEAASPLLSQIISGDPVNTLGEEGAKDFGALPFLFKILAAGKPLSIQVHPNMDQAKDGFDRENFEGIDLKAPNRNYKDPNHKPEIICALTPFTAMCGFRSSDEIKKLLDIFSRGAPQSLKTGLNSLIASLIAMDGENPLKSFLSSLFDMGPGTRQELSAYAKSQKLDQEYPEYADEWKFISWFAELYPNDPAVIAPLYLNLIDLKPGEAVYLPAGVLHAYIYGLGVELMANSDNVLRGGLTPKHIDIKELFRVLKFSPFKPVILKPAGTDAGNTPAFFRFPTPAREFALGCYKNSNSANSEITYNEKGPSIIIVTDGELHIADNVKRNTVILNKGESAFIPASSALRGLSFSGNYTAYAAGIGEKEEPGEG